MQKNHLLKTICLSVLCALALIIGMTGCGESEQQPETTPTVAEAGSNAVYIYLCGSNLETNNGSATKNIKELLSADIPENTTVVIQTGGASKWRKYDIDNKTIGRYIVVGDELQLMEQCEQANMGDGETLADFLVYCVENYPAEKMGVVLWDHGSGSINGVCFDENYNMDSLTLNELDYAFAAVREKMDEDFEFVGFDACLMANYETVSIIEKYARNMVASEELEPGGGWDYTAFNSFGTDSFYDTLLADYANKCSEKEKETYTLSHIDLQKYDSISEQFESFAATLSAVADNDMPTVVQSAAAAMNFGSNASAEGYSSMIDLVGFANNMGFEALQNAVQDAITSVNGIYREGATGISFYYPLTEIWKVADYMDISKSDAYKTYLSDRYLSIEKDEDLIEFTDLGSEEDNELHIELSPESKNYIAKVEYTAYLVDVPEDEYGEEMVISLGIDNELTKTSNTGYTTNFAGEWIFWNNEVLQIEATDEIGDLTTFSTPVIIDDVSGNVRFVYDSATKECALQGFLPDPNGGSVSRLEEINDGAEITLRHNMYDTNYEQIWYSGSTFTYKTGDVMELAPMSDGYFMIYCTVTDLYGNEYYSATGLINRVNGKNSFICITNDDADSIL